MDGDRVLVLVNVYITFTFIAKTCFSSPIKTIQKNQLHNSTLSPVCTQNYTDAIVDKIIAEPLEPINDILLSTTVFSGAELNKVSTEQTSTVKSPTDQITSAVTTAQNASIVTEITKPCVKTVTHISIASNATEVPNASSILNKTKGHHMLLHSSVVSTNVTLNTLTAPDFTTIQPLRSNTQASSTVGASFVTTRVIQTPLPSDVLSTREQESTQTTECHSEKAFPMFSETPPLADNTIETSSSTIIISNTTDKIPTQTVNNQYEGTTKGPGSLVIADLQINQTMNASASGFKTSTTPAKESTVTEPPMSMMPKVTITSEVSSQLPITSISGSVSNDSKTKEPRHPFLDALKTGLSVFSRSQPESTDDAKSESIITITTAIPQVEITVPTLRSDFTTSSITLDSTQSPLSSTQTSTITDSLTSKVDSSMANLKTFELLSTTEGALVKYDETSIPSTCRSKAQVQTPTSPRTFVNANFTVQGPSKTRYFTSIGTPSITTSPTGSIVESTTASKFLVTTNIENTSISAQTANDPSVTSTANMPTQNINTISETSIRTIQTLENQQDTSTLPTVETNSAPERPVSVFAQIQVAPATTMPIKSPITTGTTNIVTIQTPISSDRSTISTTSTEPMSIQTPINNVIISIRTPISSDNTSSTIIPVQTPITTGTTNTVTKLVQVPISSDTSTICTTSTESIFIQTPITTGSTNTETMSVQNPISSDTTNTSTMSIQTPTTTDTENTVTISVQNPISSDTTSSSTMSIQTPTTTDTTNTETMYVQNPISSDTTSSSTMSIQTPTTTDTTNTETMSVQNPIISDATSMATVVTQTPITTKTTMPIKTTVGSATTSIQNPITTDSINILETPITSTTTSITMSMISPATSTDSFKMSDIPNATKMSTETIRIQDTTITTQTTISSQIVITTPLTYTETLATQPSITQTTSSIVATLTSALVTPSISSAPTVSSQTLLTTSPEISTSIKSTQESSPGDATVVKFDLTTNEPTTLTPQIETTSYDSRISGQPPTEIITSGINDPAPNITENPPIQISTYSTPKASTPESLLMNFLKSLLTKVPKSRYSTRSPKTLTTGPLNLVDNITSNSINLYPSSTSSVPNLTTPVPLSSTLGTSTNLSLTFNSSVNSTDLHLKEFVANHPVQSAVTVGSIAFVTTFSIFDFISILKSLDSKTM